MKRTVGIICLSFLLGIGAFQIYHHNALSEPNFQKSITQISGIIACKSQSDLTRDSDVIIRGTVKEILPNEWSNPGMEKGKDVRNVLQTDVSVDIEEILKGTPYNSDNIKVRIDKGYTDDAIVNSDGYPDFTKGEKVILFLSADDSDVADKNDDYYVLTGMIQGKYIITDNSESDNNMVVNSYDSESTEQISLPEFKKEIANDIEYQKIHPVEKMTPEEIEKNNEAVLGK